MRSATVLLLLFVAKRDCMLLRVMCVMNAREGGTQMAEKDTPPHFLNARTQENTVCVGFSLALFGCCARMLLRSNGATLHYCCSSVCEAEYEFCVNNSMESLGALLHRHNMT